MIWKPIERNCIEQSCTCVDKKLLMTCIYYHLLWEGVAYRLLYIPCVLLLKLQSKFCSWRSTACSKELMVQLCICYAISNLFNIFLMLTVVLKYRFISITLLVIIFIHRCGALINIVKCLAVIPHTSS